MSLIWNALPEAVQHNHVDECPLVGNFSCYEGNRYPNCSNPLGLDLNSTELIFSLINCTTDWRVFKNKDGIPNQYGLPSQEGCEAVVGGSYRTYPAFDIWNRLTSWKLPLLQLVFLTPLPPLGRTIEFFVVMRLMGNPIGTIQAYMIKIASCHGRAMTWKHLFAEPNQGDASRTRGAMHEQRNSEDTAPENDGDEEPLVHRETAALQAQGASLQSKRGSLHYFATRNPPETWHRTDAGEVISLKELEEPFQIFQRQERLWKAFAIIIDSYDEWGREKGTNVSKALLQFLGVVSSTEPSGNLAAPGNSWEASWEAWSFLEICLETGEALAADRSTAFLPIASALLILLISIASTIFRTWYAGPYQPGLFLNIEAYSIGFTASYFWIISISFAAAIIGASQSKDRIPRILNRFQHEVERLSNDSRVSTPDGASRSKALSRGLPKAFVEHDKIFSETRTASIPNSPVHASSSLPVHASSSQPVHASSSEPENPQSPESRRHQEAEEQERARKCKGGVYSWQPFIQVHPGSLHEIDRERNGTFNYFEHQPQDASENSDSRAVMVKHFLKRRLALKPSESAVLPLWIVFSGTLCGCLICYYVPPDGIECRHEYILLIFSIWLCSWFLDRIILLVIHNLLNWELEESKSLLISHIFKDTIAALGTIALIILTQVGYLNRCSCYTSHLGGQNPFEFPQSAPAAELLSERFRTIYWALPCGFIIVVHLFTTPVYIISRFLEAVQVFVQRDDGQTNLPIWLLDVRWAFQNRCLPTWLRSGLKICSTRWQSLWDACKRRCRSFWDACRRHWRFRDQTRYTNDIIGSETPRRSR